MTLEALLARLNAGTADGTSGTPGNCPGVPEPLVPNRLKPLEKPPFGTPGTPGTPKNNKGHGATDKHEAATLDDEGERNAAEGNDHFSGVPVFQVFQQENKLETSRGCYTNSLEHRPRKPVFQVFQTADEGRFNERASVLEYDCGLTRAEASRQAATEQGFATPDELFAALAAGWAERLHALQASERSRRGQQYLTSALAFIADGWALEALRCGWSELELVGACPVAPWERLDRVGAAYSTFTPIAVTAEVVLYRTLRFACCEARKRTVRRCRGSGRSR